MPTIHTAKDLCSIVRTNPENDIPAFEQRLGVKNIDALVRQCSTIIHESNAPSLSIDEMESIRGFLLRFKSKIKQEKEKEEDNELSTKNFFTRMGTYCWRFFFGRSSAPTIKSLQDTIQSEINYLEESVIKQRNWLGRQQEFLKSGGALIETFKAHYEKDHSARDTYKESLHKISPQHSDPKQYWRRLFDLIPTHPLPDYMMNSTHPNILAKDVVKLLQILAREYNSLLSVEICDAPASARAFIYALINLPSKTYVGEADKLLISFIREFVNNPALYFTPDEHQQELCAVLSKAITQIELGRF